MLNNNYNSYFIISFVQQVHGYDEEDNQQKASMIFDALAKLTRHSQSQTSNTSEAKTKAKSADTWDYNWDK